MKTPEEMGQKPFTIDDIRSWGPCYDPSRHLPEGWSGTAIDILQHQTIPAHDKLWVVCREELIDAKTLRLFAVWCAKQFEHLTTDERCRQALAVAEQYALGNATKEQLDAAKTATEAARVDAWRMSATDDGAWDAARVAEDAVEDTAGYAAWSAAEAVARSGIS